MISILRSSYKWIYIYWAEIKVVKILNINPMACRKTSKIHGARRRLAVFAPWLKVLKKLNLENFGGGVGTLFIYLREKKSASIFVE